MLTPHCNGCPKSNRPIVSRLKISRSYVPSHTKSPHFDLVSQSPLLCAEYSLPMGSINLHATARNSSLAQKNNAIVALIGQVALSDNGQCLYTSALRSLA